MNKYISELTGSLIFKDVDGNIQSRLDPGPSSLNITGSVNISGSGVFVNGSDLVNRVTVLESGQGADQIKFGAITIWSASIDLWTGSVDTRVYSLEQSQGAITGSIADSLASLDVTSSNNLNRIVELEATASIHQSTVDRVNGSTLLSSSQQIYDLGFLTSSIGGIVSSSQQILDLGFITGSAGIFSATGSIYSTNTDIEVTGSFTLNIDGLNDTFTITSGSADIFTVNNNGVLTLATQSTVPTPTDGGMYFGSDGNFYIGL